MRGFSLYKNLWNDILWGMNRVRFSKYHALGNDFIVIDNVTRHIPPQKIEEFARKICSRNFGVGADGVLWLSNSKRAHCRVDVYNSDGSWAEKSGNGLRIVAAYRYQKYRRGRKLAIETADGVAEANIIEARGHRFSVLVTLGKPEFAAKKVPMKSRDEFHINRPLKIGNRWYRITALSVGNPHAVMFVDSLDFDWQRLGSLIEHSKYFPRRTNVEFARIINRRKLRLNDWERGAGATGSSGTGAAASVAAGVVNGLLDRKVEVLFPSGALQIEWNRHNDLIYLTGPVEFICAGESVI